LVNVVQKDNVSMKYFSGVGSFAVDSYDCWNEWVLLVLRQRERESPENEAFGRFSARNMNRISWRNTSS
jgi:hypothetical protein